MTRKTPTHNPTIVNPRIHLHGGEEFALRCSCLVAVFLRVQIDWSSELAVTQDVLHGLGFDLRLVYQPIGKQAAKIVKRRPPSICTPAFFTAGLEVAEQRLAV